MKHFRWILLLSLATLLVLPGMARAHPASKSLYWDRFDVNITVLPSGDFIVEEVQAITFTSGQFHFGYRTIPMNRLENITNVQVLESDRHYRQGHGDEYTFETFVDEGDFNIKWYFPYTSNSSHRFILRYTVQGGLRYYEDGDQLFWKAVYADRTAPVRNATVTVKLPDGAKADPVASYATEASVKGRGTDTVVFTAQEVVDPGQEFEVRVQFPHGIVEGTKPDWQAGYDRQAEWDENYKSLANLGLGALGGLILIGGPLALLLFWYLRGRDPQVSLPAEYLTEPPTNNPPGVVGTLVDEKADMQDIIATLVDLARRGYLTIEEEQESGFFGGSSYDFTFHRTEKSTDGLLPYEQRLISKLFGMYSSRRMSDLKNKFYTAIPGIKSGFTRKSSNRDTSRPAPTAHALGIWA